MCAHTHTRTHTHTHIHTHTHTHTTKLMNSVQMANGVNNLME